MRTPALPSPRRIAVGAGLALLAAGLTPIAAARQPCRHRPRHQRGLRRRRQQPAPLYNARLRRALQPDRLRRSDLERASTSSTARASGIAGAVHASPWRARCPRNGTLAGPDVGPGATARRCRRRPTQTAAPSVLHGSGRRQVLLQTSDDRCVSATRRIGRERRRRHRHGRLRPARRPSRLLPPGTATTTSRSTAARARADTDDNSADFATRRSDPDRSGRGQRRPGRRHRRRQERHRRPGHHAVHRHRDRRHHAVLVVRHRPAGRPVDQRHDRRGHRHPDHRRRVQRDRHGQGRRRRDGHRPPSRSR